MTQRISWSMSATVENGPALKFSKTAQVEAFDVAIKKVTGGGGSETLDVQPSGTGTDMQFFMINSDRFGDDLKFTVMNGGIADVVLDGPVILGGASITELLQVAPKKIKIVNDMADDVVVEIVVGRNL